MRVKFPEKIDNTLRFLKYKLLPKTLFFRTMLLIFIPLIVVQVVSIVAFFDGSWGRVGRRLSNNLTSDMSFVMQLIEKSPDKLQEIKKVTDETLDMSVSVYLNKDKHRIINKVSRNNELVTGFLESDLRRKFPDYLTSIYMGKDGDRNLTVFVDTPKRLFKFETSSKNIFSTSIFGFVAWMIGTSMLLFLVAVLFLRIQVVRLPNWLRWPKISVKALTTRISNRTVLPKFGKRRLPLLK